MGNHSPFRLPAKNVAALKGSDLSPQKRQGVLPFYAIEGIALCSDLILVVGTSVLSGIVYHLALFQTIGPFEQFLAVGALTCIIFSAILAAGGSYQPQNLVDLGRQASLTTFVWLFVFFLLSAVAFSLKISGTYSRGATLSFFVLGWEALIVWRLILARYIAHALGEGRFAEQKVLLLAEQSQLDDSSTVEELRRCGYLPVRTFSIFRDPIGSRKQPFATIESLDEIVRITRQEKIDCVFLL